MDVRAQSLEHDRGRNADTPIAIPLKGWRDIAIRTVHEFMQDRILSLSAGVAFYALLAVFPAISALVSLYGLFLDPAVLRDQLDAATWFLPSGAIEVMKDQALRVMAHGSATLGFGFLISFGVALWSANAGTKALIEALNIAYEEEERRSIISLTLLTLGFTLAAVVFACIALAVVVALPILMKVLYLDTYSEWLISLLRWPVLALTVAALITFIYRYGPCREPARWTWLSLGSLVAAVLWLGVSVGFSWYVGHFGTYNETYGSLGAVVGFMTWLWLSFSVILFGAELNAEIEHQTARDTTTAPELPMGERGATMADTIGASQ
ncbi:YihY/virulence factor BrkB family protein [Xanthobacter sp. KR7-65]|uniref:YihY/virulence factor BrkB family protein n=1 Tax=Xanthobacter sp. KR7-65 TaxID=3156612 RepID=UPI0032B32FC5